MEEEIFMTDYDRAVAKPCIYCGKKFNYFSRELEFTWFTQTPYITCPYCNSKIYPNM